MIPLRIQPVSPGLIAEIRRGLGRSLEEFAELLGVSADVARSYELGTRRPSPRRVRLLTLLLASHRLSTHQCAANCWEVKRCAAPARLACPAYRLNQGEMCWLLTGSFCAGNSRPAAGARGTNCPECAVFKLLRDGRSRQKTGSGARPRSAPKRRRAVAAGVTGRGKHALCGMSRPERALS